MYKATKEVDFNGRSYKIGETIENPTQRMIELGIVEFKKNDEVQGVKLNEVVEPLTEVLLVDDSSSVNVSVIETSDAHEANEATVIDDVKITTEESQTQHRRKKDKRNH